MPNNVDSIFRKESFYQSKDEICGNPGLDIQGEKEAGFINNNIQIRSIQIFLHEAKKTLRGRPRVFLKARKRL